MYQCFLYHLVDTLLITDHSGWTCDATPPLMGPSSSHGLHVYEDLGIHIYEYHIQYSYMWHVYDHIRAHGYTYWSPGICYSYMSVIYVQVYIRYMILICVYHIWSFRRKIIWVYDTHMCVSYVCISYMILICVCHMCVSYVCIICVYHISDRSVYRIWYSYMCIICV